VVSRSHSLYETIYAFPVGWLAGWLVSGSCLLRNLPWTSFVLGRWVYARHVWVLVWSIIVWAFFLSFFPSEKTVSMPCVLVQAVLDMVPAPQNRL